MSLSTEAYRPGVNSGRVDATASSVSVALPSGGNVLEIVNTSATLYVYCVTGVGAQTAVIPASGAIGAGWALAPLETKRIRISPNHDTFAAIGSGAGPTSVFVSRGDGM
jgi:hypothetical protein